MKVLAALAALTMTGLNLGALALAGCTPAPGAGVLPPLADLARDFGPAVDPDPVDDGTYLARIDPLGGRWLVTRLDGATWPSGVASVDFSDAFFFTTTAGCGGGYPAFYRIEGQAITITRREKVVVGKCPDRASGTRERVLAAFMDQAAQWSKPAPDRLEIDTRDGRTALFTRPAEPVSVLAGRWRVIAIDGRPFATRRPAELVFGMGGISATADCNRWGAPLRVSGSELIVGEGMQTLIGCGAEDQAKDTRLFAAVAGAKRFAAQDDGRLLLTGRASVLLARPPAPDRRLVGQYAHCGNTVGGVGHGGPVTIAATSDTLTDNAGCTARYVADGPALRLTLGDAAACRIAPAPPEGFPEVGGAISPLALLRPDGFGFAEDGRLFLHTNRGLLSLCRAGEPRRFGD